MRVFANLTLAQSLPESCDILGAAIINISRAEFPGKRTTGLRAGIATFTTHLIQDQGRFPPASLLTRRRVCRTKSSTSLCSTSFEYPTYTKLLVVGMQIGYLCFGIKAFLLSVSGVILCHIELSCYLGPMRQLSRYASNLTPGQKDALLDVVRTKTHHQIGPEVRRESASSSTRGSADTAMP